MSLDSCAGMEALPGISGAKEQKDFCITILNVIAKMGCKVISMMIPCLLHGGAPNLIQLLLCLLEMLFTFIPSF